MISNLVNFNSFEAFNTLHLQTKWFPLLSLHPTWPRNGSTLVLVINYSPTNYFSWLKMSTFPTSTLPFEGLKHMQKCQVIKLLPCFDPNKWCTNYNLLNPQPTSPSLPIYSLPCAIYDLIILDVNLNPDAIRLDSLVRHTSSKHNC